jgi:hypothetical protein
MWGEMLKLYPSPIDPYFTTSKKYPCLTPRQGYLIFSIFNVLPRGVRMAEAHKALT